MAQRASHVHRLHGSGGIIFGFSPDYFLSGCDRSKVAEFQDLLGVKETTKGKRYPMLPPILYPPGSGMDPKKLFLNPALIKVSDLSVVDGFRTVS